MDGCARPGARPLRRASAPRAPSRLTALSLSRARAVVRPRLPSRAQGFNGSMRADSDSSGRVRRRSRLSEGLSILLSAFGAASPDQRRSSNASSVAASPPNRSSRSNSLPSAAVLRRPSFGRSAASLTPAPSQRQLPTSARREATSWT